jgi:hypothetical protein
MLCIVVTNLFTDKMLILFSTYPVKIYSFFDSTKREMCTYFGTAGVLLVGDSHRGPPKRSGGNPFSFVKKTKHRRIHKPKTRTT